MGRNRWISLALAVAMGALVFATASAGDEPKKDAKAMKEMKEVTVEGILVDTKCFGMDRANWMNDHMTPKGKLPNCAQACAAMGIPVGVLEGGKQDGKVYVLITPGAALASHMAKNCKVTGMPALEGGLIPSKILVKGDGDKWEEVKIQTMM